MSRGHLRPASRKVVYRMDVQVSLEPPRTRHLLGPVVSVLSRKRHPVVSKLMLYDPVRIMSPHYPTRKTFITSSPRWLMILTAMRPVDGLSKGREMSLCRVAQASALISAFRVVLSALYGSLAPRK